MITTNKNNILINKLYTSEVFELECEGFDKYYAGYKEMFEEDDIKDYSIKKGWESYSLEDDEYGVRIRWEWDFNKELKAMHLKITDLTTGDIVENAHVINIYK